MIREVDKFRASCLQIMAFSFMVPFGRIILSLLDVEGTGKNPDFFIYFSICILLVVVGLLCLVFADIILRKGASNE